MNNLFSFEGTSTRKQWWMFVITYFVILIIASFADAALFAPKENSFEPPTPYITLIAVLLMAIPSFANNARRCHDRGKSGWFQLVCLIPIIGGLWLLIECGFLPGTDNKR